MTDCVWTHNHCITSNHCMNTILVWTRYYCRTHLNYDHAVTSICNTSRHIGLFILGCFEIKKCYLYVCIYMYIICSFTIYKYISSQFCFVFSLFWKLMLLLFVQRHYTHEQQEWREITIHTYIYGILFQKY